MKIHSLSLPGLKLIEPKVFFDERGFFTEKYRSSIFHQAAIKEEFVQDNHSFSEKGVLRGLHFQRRPGQAKLISVIEGEIFDVAVDLRLHSSTFGKWEAVVLKGKGLKEFFIPAGFAHGFCVLSDSAHVLYKTSSEYIPEEERTLQWNDPHLAIAWPIKNPILSLKDQKGLSFLEIQKELS